MQATLPRAEAKTPEVKEGKRQLHVWVEASLYDELEAFRFESYSRNQTQAIKMLLQLGLKTYHKKEKK
jgi:hypothetical protein